MIGIANMAQRLAVTLLTLMLCAARPGLAAEVLVGGYEFPPYVEVAGDSYSGITLDLITAFHLLIHAATPVICVVVRPRQRNASTVQSS